VPAEGWVEGQETQTLTNAEALLLAKYQRNERQVWSARGGSDEKRRFLEHECFI